MSITFSTQLFLGAEEKKSFSSVDIIDKIARVAGNLDLKKLMIWDVNPSDLTREIVNYCKRKNIETYLWHPVLADINNENVSPVNMAHIPFHKDLKNLSGMWDKIGKGEENFLFIDPFEKDINSRNFLQFETSMSNYDYDGVFLDRIRYPSPVNGIESIFSSYSKFCHDQNLDYKNEKNKIAQFYKDLSLWNDKILSKYNNFVEIFSDFSPFFEYKKDQIYKKVNLYSQAALKFDKKIGLDLLSVSLSFFTGQDYSLLSKQCDWIKDMTYCYGMGPAALPLEILSLTNGFRTLAPNISEEAFLEFFAKHSGLELSGSLKEIERHGIDPINALKELKSAEKQVGYSVPIYSGLEMVNSPYFSTKITSEMLEGYMDSLKGEASGVVASWNILHIPDNHFELLGRLS